MSDTASAPDLFHQRHAMPSAGAPQGVAPAGRQSRHLNSYAVQAGSVLAGLALWEVVGRYIVTNPLYFTPLSRVLRVIWDLSRSGELWTHIAATGREFAVGFAIAAAAGIAIGLLIGVNRFARLVLDPWINALYATPLVALMPLYLIIFGIGTAGKAALVVTVAIFPILINTAVGVITTEQAHLDVARAFGSSRRAVFTKIYLPSSLPHIVSGLRLGIGRGLTGVVVGEFFFANSGLGFLIARSGQSFDTPTLFAAIVILAVLAIVLSQALRYAERRLAPWREVA